MENEMGYMRQGAIVIQGKGILRCMGSAEHTCQRDVWEPRNTHDREMYGNHGTHMSEGCMGTTEYTCQRDIWKPRNTHVRVVYGNHGTHMSERCMGTTEYICQRDM